MPISCDDLENSKENLQPLPQGRREASLSGCSSSSMAPHASHHPQAQQFERELITADQSADPLDAWLRYIKWTEDQFSSGGERSHITILLERCCKKFADDPRYKDSRKYLKVWIKFADHRSAGVEDLFEFLRSKSIGQKQALFYQAWAWILESKRDYQGAEDALAEGINKGAGPVTKLTSALDAFRARRAAAMDHEEASAGTSRDALLQLQKKDAASLHRHGTQPQPLMMSSAPNEPSFNINVFNDENGTAPNRRTADPKRNIAEFSQSVVNKENISQPSNWVEPLRRPPLAPPYRPDQNHSSAPPIKVFVDESLEQREQHRTTKGNNLRNRAHGVPVSERLRVDPLQRIHQAPQTHHPPKETETAVDYERSYNFAMLNDEACPDGYSFEEIRARHYLENQLNGGQDDMPITVNYSQILSMKGPGLNTPCHITQQTPIVPNPRRLHFMMTPAANVVEVSSIENFLTSGKSLSDSKPGNAPLLVSRESVPPPSPTVTMTVETRKALQDVRSMFVDRPCQDAEDKTEVLQDDTNIGPTPDFEIYHDPTVNLQSSSTSVPKPVHSTYDGPTIDPFTLEEHLRIVGDLLKKKLPCLIDHSSVPAPDEIRDICSDQTIEVDDADLLVTSKLADRVYEAQDISNDAALILKVVRPADPWEVLMGQRLRDRAPSTRDSLVLASRAYLFEDLALVVSDLRDDIGTLQSLIDKYRSRGSVCPEPVALLYTQQLISILHALFSANVVHCQIQPKHLILGAECHIISLIDFSLSIDLNEYPKDTRFASNRITYPKNWRSEADMYGAASTIYQLLFCKELDFNQGYEGALKDVETNLPRSYARDIWIPIFTKLLTDALPATELHERIESHWQTIGTDRLKYCLCDTNILMNE